MDLPGFPSKGSFLGALAFVFLAIFLINTVANKVPTIAQLENGLNW